MTTSSRTVKTRARDVVARTSTTLLLTLRMTKRQTVRSPALQRKMMSRKTTLLSLRNKKKRRSNSVRRSKKSAKSRRLLRLSAEPNLLKLSACVSKLRLLKSWLVDRLKMRRSVSASCRRKRSSAVCVNLRPQDSDLRKKRLMPRQRLLKMRRNVRRSLHFSMSRIRPNMKQRKLPVKRHLKRSSYACSVRKRRTMPRCRLSLLNSTSASLRRHRLCRPSVTRKSSDSVKSNLREKSVSVKRRRRLSSSDLRRKLLPACCLPPKLLRRRELPSLKLSVSRKKLTSLTDRESSSKRSMRGRRLSDLRTRSVRSSSLRRTLVVLDSKKRRD